MDEDEQSTSEAVVWEAVAPCVVENMSYSDADLITALVVPFSLLEIWLCSFSVSGGPP